MKTAGAGGVVPMPACLADSAPSLFVSRLAALYTRVNVSAAIGAALRHGEIGERFAYLRVEHGSKISSCACPDRRAVVLGRAGDSSLGIVMAELGAVWGRALASDQAQQLPVGSDFVVILGDFDGNRDRRRAGRRDADESQPTVAALHQAPPPIVVSAFAAEHAVAAPTFTWALTGWGSRFPAAEVAARRAGRFAWEQRAGVLVWRGATGAANHNLGRDHLINASRSSPAPRTLTRSAHTGPRAFARSAQHHPLRSLHTHGAKNPRAVHSTTESLAALCVCELQVLTGHDRRRLDR